MQRNWWRELLGTARNPRFHQLRLFGLPLLATAILICRAPQAWEDVRVDPETLFAHADAEGRVGVAQKSKLVDARPAAEGEIVITVIVGEGKETQSQPAKIGDMVVRNRCEVTGNEQYLVKKETCSATLNLKGQRH